MRTAGCKNAHYETLWLALDAAADGRTSELECRIRVEPVTFLIYQWALRMLEKIHYQATPGAVIMVMKIFCETSNLNPKAIQDRFKEMIEARG